MNIKTIFSTTRTLKFRILNVIVVTFTLIAFASANSYADDLSYCINSVLNGNYSTAFNSCYKSCNLGQFGGCTFLGRMYQKGLGVSPNIHKALTYYEKSCNQGEAVSCSNIGIIHLNAEGVSKDYHKAKKYFEKSCSLGSGIGCNNLGGIYEEGFGVPKSASKLIYYYSKACDLGEGFGYTLESFLEKVF